MSQETKATFIPTDWILARKAWGKNTPDPHTGERGATLYWPDTGGGKFLSKDKSTALVSFVPNQTTDRSDDEAVVYVAHYGGHEMFEKLPDNAYINVSEDYDGDTRLLEVDDYTSLCSQHGVSAPTRASLTASLRN